MALTVVTGANRGIGLALTRELAAKGRTILAACRQPSPELAKLGAEVADGIDVATDAGIARLAERVGAREIELLVNNAGVLASDSLGDLDLESLRRQFEINALGPLRVTQALAAKLARGAKVALITSRMGSIGDNSSGGYYGYRMSKAALNAAGMSLAHDLRARGVAVVILHPGYVRTEMTGSHGGIDPSEAARGLVARIEELSLETSGRFLHQNGESLPW